METIILHCLKFPHCHLFGLPVQILVRNHNISRYSELKQFLIAPQSYEECKHIPHVSLNKEDQHDYGEGDFVPRYPVFNLPEVSVPALESEPEHDNGTWL